MESRKERSPAIIVLEFAAEIIVELEGRRSDGVQQRVRVVIATLGQGIRHGVEAAQPVFDVEVVYKKLAHPLMLRHSG